MELVKRYLAMINKVGEVSGISLEIVMSREPGKEPKFLPTPIRVKGRLGEPGVAGQVIRELEAMNEGSLYASIAQTYGGQNEIFVFQTEPAKFGGPVRWRVTDRERFEDRIDKVQAGVDSFLRGLGDRAAYAKVVQVLDSDNYVMILYPDD